ncbi:MAG: acyl-CoA dehydrogenase family protein [Actinomycetes bacterium]|jgi:alkylation response protein AidB-like acyl-CoA dehydrogenase
MEALLAELREFLTKEFPAWCAKWPDGEIWEAKLDWQRTMAEGRWSTATWPQEFGGRGLGTIEMLAIEDVVAQYGVPQIPGMIGVKNVAPTLMRFGTEEQRKSVARIANTDEFWCQGFSEPGAGSDLASLRTRAVIDGDEFVINGQKVWTSNGMYSTHMQLLARTDPDAPKHKGISAIVVPINTPGLEVRPIKQINGGAEFAEVFFTDVRVPVANLIGPLNEGWNVTMTTLGHERAGVAVFAGRLEQRIRNLIEDVTKQDTPVSPILSDQLAEHYVESRVLGMMGSQMLAKIADGVTPGSESSVIKMVWSELSQQVDTTIMQLSGVEGITGDDNEAKSGYLSARSATIAAGTSDIVKNIIGDRVLGLPRD